MYCMIYLLKHITPIESHVSLNRTLIVNLVAILTLREDQKIDVIATIVFNSSFYQEKLLGKRSVALYSDEILKLLTKMIGCFSQSNRSLFIDSNIFENSPTLALQASDEIGE